MKVLLAMTQFYQLGGAERLSLELATELNRRGVRAEVVSMYAEDLPGVAEARAELRDRGIPAVHFLGLRVHPPLASLLPAVQRMRRLIRQQGCDVVESSGLSPSVIASWATLGTGVGHVAGLHQVFRRDRDNTMQHRFWRFSLRCNRRTRYYGVSRSVVEHWIEYQGVPAHLTRTVYNSLGGEPDRALRDRQEIRRELGVPPGARLVLYVGRLSLIKGVDSLLEAIDPILVAHDLHLVCAGLPDTSVAGTPELVERLRRRSEHEERIRLLGYRRDVPELMAAADLLVHPARTEAFGLVLLEALAAGLPVVATDVEGIPEVLEGTDSIMVRPDDPAALRAAMLEALHRTPAEKQAAEGKGRSRARAFGSDRRADAMIHLFEDVLAGRF